MSLQSQSEEWAEAKLSALEEENKRLRSAVQFHEQYAVSERKEKAHAILVAMIKSPRPGTLDVKAWARKAYEFVDALESEGEPHV